MARIQNPRERSRGQGIVYNETDVFHNITGSYVLGI